MSTLTAADRTMLEKYGYIDRRDQSSLTAEDRLRPIPVALTGDEGCQGCAATSCACGRYSTASSNRPETLRQAQTWETVKQSYVGDGFCEPCSVQAAYGHQIGFSMVAPVCPDCHGKRPTWRRAGDESRRWAGDTLVSSGRQQIGSLTVSADLAEAA